MASEEDLAALRLFYHEVARGNFWVGKDVFDPDIEWEWSSSLGAITGSRTYRGFDDVSAATNSGSCMPWNSHLESPGDSRRRCKPCM
jgi:hypothetical protein